MVPRSCLEGNEAVTACSYMHKHASMLTLTGHMEADRPDLLLTTLNNFYGVLKPSYQL